MSWLLDQIPAPRGVFFGAPAYQHRDVRERTHESRRDARPIKPADITHPNWF